MQKQLNSLKNLLTAAGYRACITKDPGIRVLVKDKPYFYVYMTGAHVGQLGTSRAFLEIVQCLSAA